MTTSDLTLSVVFCLLSGCSDGKDPGDSNTLAETDDAPEEPATEEPATEEPAVEEIVSRAAAASSEELVEESQEPKPDLTPAEESGE